MGRSDRRGLTAFRVLSTLAAKLNQSQYRADLWVRQTKSDCFIGFKRLGRVTFDGASFSNSVLNVQGRHQCLHEQQDRRWIHSNLRAANAWP